MAGQVGDGHARFDELCAALDGAACLGPWSLQADTGELMLAPALAALLGLDGPAVGIAQGLARLHPADRLRVESQLYMALETGEPFEAEFRTLGRARGPRRLRAMGRADRPRADRPCVLRGLAFDLTDGPVEPRAVAGRAQRQANKLAEHVIAMHGLVDRLHNPTLADAFMRFERAVGVEIARHLYGSGLRRPH